MIVSNRICRAFLTSQAEIAASWRLFSAISAFAGFVSGLRDGNIAVPFFVLCTSAYSRPMIRLLFSHSCSASASGLSPRSSATFAKVCAINAGSLRRPRMGTGAI